MADLLYIANAALDMVGQGNIVSLDDPTPAAKKAKLHIYEAVRQVLTLGKWKCATDIVALTQITDDPAFGWELQYQLPNDYLRMVSFNDTDPDNLLRPLYDVQGKRLLTDETTASIAYVKDLTASGNDIAAASAPLVELFTVKLAQKLAWGMQQSRTLRESLVLEYRDKRREALAADAKEVRKVLVNPAADSTWLRARFSSTAG